MFWTKGDVTVRGGTFESNVADARGGVMLLSDGGMATLVNGTFADNEAGGGGGVVFVESGAKLLVEGGAYSKNEARGNGGAFSVGEDANIEVRMEHKLRLQASTIGPPVDRFSRSGGLSRLETSESMIVGNAKNTIMAASFK